MASKTQKSKSVDSDTIVQAYMDYVLTEHKQPASIYAFAKQLNVTESEFYKFFNQFSDIDAFIWKQASSNAIDSLKAGAEYKDYNSREKFLGLFYTLIEVLNQNRSYFIYSIKSRRPLFKNNEGIKSEILTFAKEIIHEGLNSNEIEDRKFISERYHDAVWMNTLFILNFWMDDSSIGFEKTDAAIEKSVNLMMELMGKGALDNILDMGKFLLQNNKLANFKF